MPELAQPLWLLGLALVPAVRWLHRLHAPRDPLRVPALFLWREAGTAPTAGQRRARPDPAWRHRAVLLALSVLALAGPAWMLSGSATAEVWLDDGPALFAREPGTGDRIGEAALALANAAVETKTNRLRVKTLRRPGQSLELRSLDARAIENGLRAWLDGPGGGSTLPRTSTDAGPRWLVSSGADQRTLDALAGLAFDRVIPVGLATENQGLTGLSLRPSFTDPRQLRGLVEVWGTGRVEAQRTLALRLDGRILERVELRVPPEASIGHAFALDEPPPATLEALLEPAATDSLPLDDSLSLDLAGAIPGAAVAIEGTCDASLATFLSAHPGLRPATSGADIVMRCDAAPPQGEMPALWLVQGKVEDTARDPPVWDIEFPAVPPQLAPEWLRPVSPPAPVEGRVLLAAGARPLIVDQQNPRRIVVLFDTAGLVERPELPAVLGLLLDRLAGRELLMPVVRVARDPLEVRVAPGRLPSSRSGQAKTAGRLEIAPWLIAGAFGLAVYDLGRRARAMLAT